jgi:mRNA interferase MazF
MKRGDVIMIALSGDYGKPRPGVIVQSDLFLDTGSVTILPLTSHFIDAPLFRIIIEPSTSNGLNQTSYIMIDKLYTTPREKIGNVIGSLELKTMAEIARALALFIGIA